MLCDTFDEMFSSPQYISPHHMNMYSIYVCLSVHPPTVLTLSPSDPRLTHGNVTVFDCTYVVHLRCALYVVHLRCTLWH